MATPEDVKEKEEYVCIHCGQPVTSLYQKYSEGVIRLTDCTSCGEIVDKYIEYDTVLVVVDLILQYAQAYRHLLYNIRIEKPLRLMIIFLLSNAYDKWITSRVVTGAQKIYDLELIFYESILAAFTEMFSFLLVVVVFEFIVTPSEKRSQSRLRHISFSTLFGFYGNVAVVLSIVFRLSTEISYRSVVLIFMMVSHLQVQRVIYPEVNFFVNIGVVATAKVVSTYAAQSIQWGIS